MKNLVSLLLALSFVSVGAAMAQDSTTAAPAASPAPAKKAHKHTATHKKHVKKAAAPAASTGDASAPAK